MKIKERPCGCKIYGEREVSRNPSPAPGTPLPPRPICRLKPQPVKKGEVKTAVEMEVKSATKKEEVEPTIYDCIHPDLLKPEKSSDLEFVLSINMTRFIEYMKAYEANLESISSFSLTEKPEIKESNEKTMDIDLKNVENATTIETSNANPVKPSGTPDKAIKEPQGVVPKLSESSAAVLEKVESKDENVNKPLVSEEYGSSEEDREKTPKSGKLNSKKSGKISSSEKSPVKRKSHSKSPSRKADSKRSLRSRSRTPARYRSPSPEYRPRTADTYSRESCGTWEASNFEESEMLVCLGNGSYYCKYCDASMNSDATWSTHLSGKRHAKNVRQQSLHKVALATVSTQILTRYPPPPVGMKRIKSSDIAEIQYIVDDLKAICPGVNDVIEIHTTTRKMYYCELCDAPCSADTILPHLTGIKHHLRCLKRIDPELHDKMQNEPTRFEYRKKMQKILLNDERKYGRGRLRVEKDVPDESYTVQPTYNYWARSTREESVVSVETGGSEVIPDTSKNDFYCAMCDSHMNNSMMWEAHIRGKRHLKNMKKAPGEKPSGTKYILCRHARPKLNDYLRDVYSPIVGLDYIRETQNPDAGEMYNCFLCGACCASDIVDHILTVKHRTKYLKKIGSENVEGILQLDVANITRSSLIEEECQRAEEEFGRGIVEVYVKTA